MKVKDVMMGTPYYCHPDANLGSATELMWKANCGFLPVVDAVGKVVGVITDRDICIALGTRNLTAGQVLVQDVLTQAVHSCLAEDEIHVALQTMKDSRVRRLPVLDKEEHLAGVVSMDDVLLHAEPNRFGEEPELSSNEVVRTYRSIMRKDLPIIAKRAAA